LTNKTLPMLEKTIKIRPYKPGDEEKIVRLYNETFRRNRSLAHWQWKYKDNPYLSEPICAIASSEDDRNIVGHYTVIPLKIDFMGEPILGCQFTDTMVDPHFRQSGLYLKTARVCYEDCLNRGFKVVYGFPNRSAYPGFMRRLGGMKVAHFSQYVARIGITKSFSRVFKNRLLTGALSAAYDYVTQLTIEAKGALYKRELLARQPLVFKVSRHINEKYDSLWNVIRSYEVLSIWKDTEYLRWRYEKNPDHTFDYFSIEEGGELIAFAVVHSEKDTVVICELQVKGKDIPLGRYFVNRIRQHYIGKGKTALTFIGHDSGYYRSVFKDFDERPYFRYRFCGKVLNESDRVRDFFPFPHNWNITYGDIDNL